MPAPQSLSPTLRCGIVGGVLICLNVMSTCNNWRQLKQTNAALACVQQSRASCSICAAFSPGPCEPGCLAALPDHTSEADCAGTNTMCGTSWLQLKLLFSGPNRRPCVLLLSLPACSPLRGEHAHSCPASSRSGQPGASLLKTMLWPRARPKTREPCLTGNSEQSDNHCLKRIAKERQR